MPLPLSPHVGKVDKSLATLIRLAGLSSVLHMCIDPGTRACYNGGQTLVDLKGNVNMQLGASGSGGTDDPAFTGTIGRASDAEGLVFDGVNDIITAVANDTFLNGLAKVGANYAMVMIAAGFATGSVPLLTTGAGTAAAPGQGIATYKTATTNTLTHATCLSGGGTYSSSPSTITVPVAQTTPQMIGIGKKLTAGNDRDTQWYAAGTFEQIHTTASVTYSTVNPGPLKYGGYTDLFVPANHRLCGIAIFERLLTQAEYDALRAQCLKRWPTI